MDKNKKIAGVSLVELMIAMVLIAMALVAIVGVFPRTSSHRRSISEADQARIIAMEVLEGLQRLVGEDFGFSSCNTLESVAANIDPNDPTPNPIPVLLRDINARWSTGAATYTATVESTDCSDNGINTATIKVTWTKSGRSRPGSITVTGAIR
ncbi:MAG: prepilin-type N-terminal cleavage/methylation domain-containing protein [Chitinispirillales bacterium]|jgi:type II secretory pathway pseudopilin PulG|nr:prepilin-type N-terminal cleavage/methylation domain-containing protein [Chitinispirillales bacterium]